LSVGFRLVTNTKLRSSNTSCVLVDGHWLRKHHVFDDVAHTGPLVMTSMGNFQKGRGVTELFAKPSTLLHRITLFLYFVIFLQQQGARVAHVEAHDRSGAAFACDDLLRCGGRRLTSNGAARHRGSRHRMPPSPTSTFENLSTI
jgi:hypothetical protein